MTLWFITIGGRPLTDSFIIMYTLERVKHIKMSDAVEI